MAKGNVKAPSLLACKVAKLQAIRKINCLRYVVSVLRKRGQKKGLLYHGKYFLSVF